jgi:hypothetical protein
MGVDTQRLEEERDPVDRTGLRDASVGRDWTALIALAAALVSLAAAVVGFVQVADVRKVMGTLTTCSGSRIWIDKPQQGQLVQDRGYAEGTATFTDACQFVFLIVRVERPDGAMYCVTDAVQTDLRGHWKGRVQFQDADVGATIRIEARLGNRAELFDVGACMRQPPDIGVRSNVIEVERVQ